MTYTLEQMPVTIQFLFHHYLEVNVVIIIAFLGVSWLLHDLVNKKEANALYDKRANPSEYDPPVDFPPAFLATVPSGVSVGHTMGATIVDLTRRGYLTAQNDANGAKFAKVDGIDESTLFSFEIDLLRGMFDKKEIFHIPEDVGSAFDRANDFGFSKHELGIYMRLMRDKSGGQDLSAELDRGLKVIIFSIFAAFFVCFVFWPFFPAAIIAAIATPYIIVQTYTLTLTQRSAVYREYIEHQTNLKAYRDYLQTAAPFFDQSEDVAKWDKHTPYRIAFGLHAYWSPVFKKDAFLNPELLDRS